MTLHPLPALVRHFPEEARAFYEERAGIIEHLDHRTREEAERIAEHITRAWWEQLRSAEQQVVDRTTP